MNALEMIEESERTNPSKGYQLALRMMDASEALGATVADYQKAVCYIDLWCKRVSELQTAGTLIADVQSSRRAFLEELRKDQVARLS